MAGLAVMIGGTGILIGTFFLNSLYLHDVQGASALRTGLEFLPLVAVIGLGAHTTARLLPRVGSRVLSVVGLVLMGGGALLLSAVSVRSGYLTGVLPGLLLIGAGTGAVFPAASVTALNDAVDDRAGVASGLLTTAHDVGAALGVASVLRGRRRPGDGWGRVRGRVPSRLHRRRGGLGLAWRPSGCWRACHAAGPGARTAVH